MTIEQLIRDLQQKIEALKTTMNFAESSNDERLYYMSSGSVIGLETALNMIRRTKFYGNLKT